MAVGESLPPSFSVDVDSSFPPAHSSPLCSFRRRFRSLAHLSPCIFFVFLLCFFLVFQYDLIPAPDSPRLRDLLTKIRILPLGQSLSPPMTSTWKAPPPKASSSSSSVSKPAPSITISPPSPSSSNPASESIISSITAGNSSETSTKASNATAIRRVAICLVGGARAFELTGHSIKKYLIHTLDKADVFVHSPFDKDSYKLGLLNDIPNLVRFRVFTPQHMQESREAIELLTASGSPNGIQGLLQYFNLVEGCSRMIREYQLKNKFEYDWVVRTRLDGYWTGPLPSLNTYDPFTYSVPIGSQFGGLNDRLGIGNWDTSDVAFSRLSLIPVLHAHGSRGLNSETSFRQQLKVRNISYKLLQFPFCILSRRKYGYPPGGGGVPVLSISSKGNLNGAKCRPCTPASSGSTAKSMLSIQDHHWSWPGNIEGPELCNGSGDWESGWEQIFDKVAGPENAEARRNITTLNLSTCIEANEALRKKAQEWDAPEPRSICEKGLGS